MTAFKHGLSMTEKYGKTKTGKASRGTVGIESLQGRLRLTIPASISPDGKQKRPSLGLSDTPVNRAKAEGIALQATLDLSTGNFDLTLEKYLGIAKPVLTVVSSTPSGTTKTEPTLGELWGYYIDWLRPTSKPATLKNYEIRFSKLLIPYMGKELNQSLAVVIRNDLVSLGNESAKRTLSALEAMVELCVQHSKSHLIKNPFFGMSDEIKVKKRVNKETGEKNEYKAFTKDERDLIISECYKRAEWLGNYIYAKFHTGARPGELIALTWGDVNADFTKISINKTWDSNTRQLILTTKTGEDRTFYLHSSLANWFRSKKPVDAKGDDLVFVSSSKGQITASSVQKLWGGRYENNKTTHGVVDGLAHSGLIAEYLPPYNTRHTYINIALDSGYTPTMVTSQCGNSEDVISEFYRSKDRNPNWDLLDKP